MQAGVAAQLLGGSNWVLFVSGAAAALTLSGAVFYVWARRKQLRAAAAAAAASKRGRRFLATENPLRKRGKRRS
jgi:hypothetical protein